MDQTALNSPLYPALAHPETEDIPAGMARQQFRAMGTTITVVLPEVQVQRGGKAVRALFTHWEETLSRFLPDSELSYLNQQAGKSLIVSPLLFTVLQTAFNAAHETGGIYDPTLLNQLEQIGYDRTFEEIPEVVPVSETERPLIPGGGWRGIKLEPILRRVTLPAGIRVEVGGIAKGMAVDAALAQLQEMGIETALVNAGGDLAVMGTPPGGDIWPLTIPGKEHAWIMPFHHGALATSGISHRHWKQGTRTRHHLIDPLTGESAESGLWSVTVAATLCQQAEVAAKVAFILGQERGSAFLHRHKLAGLFIHEDGHWTATAKWPVSVMR